MKPAAGKTVRSLELAVLAAADAFEVASAAGNSPALLEATAAVFAAARALREARPVRPPDDHPCTGRTLAPGFCEPDLLACGRCIFCKRVMTADELERLHPRAFADLRRRRVV